MIRIFTIIFAGILLSACKTTAIKNNSDVAPQLGEAERLGQMLFRAVLSEDGTSPYTSREKDLIEMSQELHCEGEYTAVSVIDESQEIENLYLILTSSKDQGVQFGRHIRFRFKLGTNDLIDVSPSTRSCLLVPSSEDSIPFSTHLLTQTPTEFHVFLSLFHQKPLYVSTSAGLWSIENGKISDVRK